MHRQICVSQAKKRPPSGGHGIPVNQCQRKRKKESRPGIVFQISMDYAKIANDQEAGEARKVLS